ncbi:spermidine/putrescine transport system permease protein [Candidatus Kryptonium thompsonii]|uniref:Spermidine/putrescine transport system permease protein n=1 Tax=Candidatus Kryptonium thompsonii TaxID=1633631 RepID=A0A0P1P5R3_9BACT|nr:ABC transporter permease [Candidatus Kryptonium thompsoni]CUS77354.1 spermidine/putrescine transport system permease protein [Candidatus Kryptonium thompsoni]CUS78281.1 spermidine/putrescine transport system permease protein [Candidatus Kryptonium thompsoni]CUS81131.1 spermidine/putrescine transport system permease protein [Candidatus Kryptonium thompsoni]CUS86676.1 spermidine/putrescine transport system permease protein [Candidatus Kryptonium thompsoni]CUS87100.1 spermidine/putrescine tran
MRGKVYWVFLIPSAMVLIVFFLFPLLIMLYYSFLQRGIYGGFEPIENLKEYIFSFAWLKNYIRVFDSLYIPIYLRSIYIAILTTIICLFIGYPVAYFIALKVKPENKILYLFLIIVPLWTSFLIRTYAWILILRDEGLINLFLLKIGLINKPLPLLYNEFSVLLGLIYGELPFMILPIYASLEKIDISLIEASKDLGADEFRTFKRVILPLTLPGIIVGVTIVFIPTLGSFIVSDLLGGAKSILVGNLIQNQFIVARDKPFGSAIAFVLSSFVLVLLYIYRKFWGGKIEVL